MSWFFIAARAKWLSSKFGLRKNQKIKWSISKTNEPKKIPKRRYKSLIDSILPITKNMDTKTKTINEARRW